MSIFVSFSLFLCSIIRPITFIPFYSNAKIWLRSKRELNRVYAQSTDHQKRFLFLPKNVLLEATNFKELVYATATERQYAHPENLVDEIFNSLPQIDSWIPALSHLKFNECSNAEPIDESNEGDVDTKFITPRSSRKRKVRNCLLE